MCEGLLVCPSVSQSGQSVGNRFFLSRHKCMFLTEIDKGWGCGWQGKRVGRSLSLSLSLSLGIKPEKTSSLVSTPLQIKVSQKALGQHGAFALVSCHSLILISVFSFLRIDPKTKHSDMVSLTASANIDARMEFSSRVILIPNDFFSSSIKIFTLRSPTFS